MKQNTFLDFTFGLGIAIILFVVAFLINAALVMGVYNYVFVPATGEGYEHISYIQSLAVVLLKWSIFPSIPWMLKKSFEASQNDKEG